ncbi:MAG: hypothetical protein AAFY88_04650, partial [Acidobacteriota bacterium]
AKLTAPATPFRPTFQHLLDELENAMRHARSTLLAPPRRHLIGSLLLGALISSATAPDASADVVTIGSERAVPGDTVTLPVYVQDESFTALGVDQPLDLRIQSFSVGVRPTSAFATSVSFTRAGVLETLTPIFETTVQAGQATHWINAYDGAGAPIPFVLDQDVLVGWIDVTVSATTPLGTRIELELAPGLTALSNQGGAVMVNGVNGGLGLDDGHIDVDSPPIFADGFESGDTSAWTNQIP